MTLDEVFVGDASLGALMREVDWAKTPLGPVESWPQSLRTSLSICLSSRIPIVIFWGSDLALLYNQAYVALLGNKHPDAIGQPGLVVWSEIRDVIEPMLRGVMHTGEATWSEDLMLAIRRGEIPEESYFTFTYSPIRVEAGVVGGVFCAVVETTDHVLEERRLRLLNALAETTSSASSVRSACAQAAVQISRAGGDVPFALLYLVDVSSSSFELVGAANIEPGTEQAPRVIRAGDRTPWPIDRGVTTIAKLDAPIEGATEVVVLPMERLGFIVVGLSPLLSKSPSYERFHRLLAASISQAIAKAIAYEEERRRAEALAEIDRAKTAFFSNVSHEFRTPLTLILGPMEEALASPRRALEGENLETAHRNVLRLSKLVNTLLDFSRIEAGRAHATYESTDLAALTAELASVFRSAIEHAGLRFLVEMAPLPESDVYVDRDMWEKIVLNLLSNALKFTFSGQISISLRPADKDVVLVVQDTGTGIPASELPHLFERFHRVRGATARTHEGSGIGLALVSELVKLHGGTIRVESEEGRGTMLEVRVPMGAAHLPKDRVMSHAAPAHAIRGAAPYVEEALRWLPASTERGSEPPVEDAMAVSARSRERIVLADDNADMREYLVRLLSERWEVEAVGDGHAALEALRRRPPHLLLSDVMMPGLDGFALLRAVRSDEMLKEIPVILVSARAGEEATEEGLRAGADDYLVKPFTARELFARITAKIATSKNARALRENAIAIARLHRLGSFFLAEPSAIEPVLLEIVDAAIDIAGSDFGNIQLLDSQTSDLRIVAQRGFPAWWLDFWNTVSAGQGTCGTALERHERVVVEDVEQSPIFVGTPALEVQRRVGVRAVISTPLFSRSGKPIGMFSTHFRSPHRPDEQALQRLDLLARQAADIVERATTEEALRRSEERFRVLAEERGALAEERGRLVARIEEQRQMLYSLFMQAPSPICILRGTQHVIELANPQCCEVWGRRHEEVIGRRLFDALPEIEYQGFKDLLNRVLVTGEPYVGKETPAEMGPGGARRKIYFNFVYAPMRGPSATIDGVLVIAFDVTDEVRARDELARTVRFNEMFAGILGHDLRNPLGAIMSGAELLLMRSDRSDIAGPAKRILASGGRMSRMIDQLLDFTRIRLGNGLAITPQTVDAADLARRVLDELETASPDWKGVVEQDGDTRGQWDPDRLAQMVSNLAGNARQHGATRSARIRLDGNAPERLLMTFENDGAIADELLSTLFDPFVGSRESTRRSGLGLGLYITKAIVAAHGGSISAESADGCTRFTVALPRSAMVTS